MRTHAILTVALAATQVAASPAAPRNVLLICVDDLRPFFLALGFYKPHLPFVAPLRHWEKHDPDSIPPAAHPEPAAGTDPKVSLHNNYEPTTHYHWPEGAGKVSPESGKILKHGYRAAVSYIDEQIGRVLDRCRELGLEENTIIVLWSDQGWHLDLN